MNATSKKRLGYPPLASGDPATIAIEAKQKKLRDTAARVEKLAEEALARMEADKTLIDVDALRTLIALHELTEALENRADDVEWRALRIERARSVPSRRTAGAKRAAGGAR